MGYLNYRARIAGLAIGASSMFSSVYAQAPPTIAPAATSRPTTAPTSAPTTQLTVRPYSLTPIKGTTLETLTNKSFPFSEEVVRLYNQDYLIQKNALQNPDVNVEELSFVFARVAESKLEIDLTTRKYKEHKSETLYIPTRVKNVKGDNWATKLIFFTDGDYGIRAASQPTTRAASQPVAQKLHDRFTIREGDLAFEIRTITIAGETYLFPKTEKSIANSLDFHLAPLAGSKAFVDRTTGQILVISERGVYLPQATQFEKYDDRAQQLSKKIQLEAERKHAIELADAERANEETKKNNEAEAQKREEQRRERLAGKAVTD